MRYYDTFTFQLSQNDNLCVTIFDGGSVGLHYMDYGSIDERDERRIDGHGFRIDLLPAHIPAIRELLAALELQDNHLKEKKRLKERKEEAVESTR